MMAESRTVTVVPLSSTNYTTWKVQCKMALIKEGLWNIVNRTETMTIFEDNQSTICLARNQSVHEHINIKYHFIRDLVEAGRIELSYCSTENMVADILTKGVAIKQFEKLRCLAGVAEFAD